MCLPMDSTCGPCMPQHLVGYKFKPNEKQIYSYFIPRRVLLGQPLPGVTELDLYGSKTPDDLFGWCKPEVHIYFFTRLKKQKAKHTRIQRGAGGGTWHGQKPKDCDWEINGKTICIGTMRQFSFKRKVAGKENDEWVLHEYSVEENYLNYLRNDPTSVSTTDLNPENIVFCDVYKKAKKGVELKRKCEEYRSVKKRRLIANNAGTVDACNVVSSVQEQERSNMLRTSHVSGFDLPGVQMSESISARTSETINLINEDNICTTTDGSSLAELDALFDIMDDTITGGYNDPFQERLLQDFKSWFESEKDLVQQVSSTSQNAEILQSISNSHDSLGVAAQELPIPQAMKSINESSNVYDIDVIESETNASVNQDSEAWEELTADDWLNVIESETTTADANQLETLTLDDWLNIVEAC